MEPSSSFPRKIEKEYFFCASSFSWINLKEDFKSNFAGIFQSSNSSETSTEAFLLKLSVNGEWLLESRFARKPGADRVDKITLFAGLEFMKSSIANRPERSARIATKMT